MFPEAVWICRMAFETRANAFKMAGQVLLHVVLKESAQAAGAIPKIPAASKRALQHSHLFWHFLLYFSDCRGGTLDPKMWSIMDNEEHYPLNLGVIISSAPRDSWQFAELLVLVGRLQMSPPILPNICLSCCVCQEILEWCLLGQQNIDDEGQSKCEGRQSVVTMKPSSWNGKLHSHGGWISDGAKFSLAE